MKIPLLQLSSGLWHGLKIETYGKAGLRHAMYQINKETSQKMCTFTYFHVFGKVKLYNRTASLFTENGG
jgi:hypothetical protein